MLQGEQARIHRNMTISDIFSLFPHKSQKLAQEITNAGLHCVGCHASTWETLEAGMMGHGKSEQEIERLEKRLNQILDEEAPANTITLTPKAATQFLKILEEEQKLGWGLRFGERAAGCSGFEFYLDFSEKNNEDDIVIESHGVQIHIQQESLSRLMGSVIDFVEGLNGSGFKISNPNVRTSCGCGNSHNY